MDISEENYLYHYGVKGQKKGVRRYQYEDKSLTPEGRIHYGVGEPRKSSSAATLSNGNAKRLDNYSGPALFVSEAKFEDGKTLDPRIPNNYFTKHGYEDDETPRVSFAPSIDKCLAGLSKNVEGKTFYVYSPDDISECEIYKPNSKAVPDSDITGELWCTNPVKIKRVGKIKVTGNRGELGKSFTYGDKSAELFDDWIFEEV